MSVGEPSARSILRRVTGGSGPLKRGSDRLELLSRLLLLLIVLAAAPTGLAMGTATSFELGARAAEEATTRVAVRATLLEDVPLTTGSPSEAPGATAAWVDAGGRQRTGHVSAPAGAPAGRPVEIWIDRTGEPTTPPLSAETVAQQSVLVGLSVFLGVVLAGAGVHLTVLGLLGRHRSRQWEAGWAAVEPLWLSRFR